MQQVGIHWDDWHRIFFGEVSPIFLVEIIFRVFFIYLVLTVSMRLMGKRMASQLSRNEMAALTSLAAAIGVPILDAHRGLLATVVIAAVVVAIQRIVSRLAATNQKFESMTQGNIATLIEESVLNLDEMQDVRITRELLFAQIRSSGLYHLGSVKRLFMEANGEFTLIAKEQPGPGLSVIPEWDTDLLDEQTKSDQLVCHHCGNPKPEDKETDGKCSNCGQEQWEPALQ